MLAAHAEQADRMQETDRGQAIRLLELLLVLKDANQLYKSITSTGGSCNNWYDVRMTMG